MSPVEVVSGAGTVVLGMPHCGLHLPDEVRGALNETGRALADTDWHVDRLYDGLLPDPSIVRAKFHRYVIDANRDPSGASLYPGQNTTGLCPLTDFNGRPLYREGREPDAAEIERRLRAFHTPYHAALAAELERVRHLHGVAVLYDCHSIRSEIPFLFDGRLADLNIGTNDGTSCARPIETGVRDICAGADGYTAVLNGRFKGGWTTRHHGRPATGVHAVQMELTQRCYLAAEAPPWTYDEAKARRLRHLLGEILHAIAETARQIGEEART